MNRAGWRCFVCPECDTPFEEATRDALSPSSSECPKCNTSSHPAGFWLDDTLERDSMGNLTMPWAQRVRIIEA